MLRTIVWGMFRVRVGKLRKVVRRLMKCVTGICRRMWSRSPNATTYNLFCGVFYWFSDSWSLHKRMMI